MSIFGVGIVVLFVMTAIFYIVFFSFIYYWHLKKITYVVLPVMFVFEYFVVGFFTVALISIILDYLPQVLRAGGL